MPRNKAQDDKMRSKESHERGKGAPKKGNPRYQPKMITDKNGNKRKVYVVRNRSNEKRSKKDSGMFLSDMHKLN